MKRLIYLIPVIVLLLAAQTANAQARCPIRADRLEDFARCMAPMRGTIGTTTVYSSGKYDRDNAQLVSAMMRSQVVQPHVVPPSVGQTFPYSSSYMTSPVSWMNLYFAGHSSYRNNWFRFASFYSPFYRYNPNMWIYAHYRH